MRYVCSCLVVWLAVFGGGGMAPPAHAQLLDIITGHVRDLKARFADDETVAGKVIKRGVIDEDAPGQDSVHNGKGSVTIVENDEGRFVQTGADFSISLAPDLHIYVSAAAPISEEKDFYATDQVELGRLKKGSGASYYKIPAGVEVNAVTVMCKKFREYMASAALSDAAAGE